MTTMGEAQVKKHLRVVTLNIHKGLSQFNRRVVIHELREGLRALDADIVFLQEVQGHHAHHARRHATWPTQPQHALIADTLWGEAASHVYGQNAVYRQGHHGNAVLSRYALSLVANHDVSNHRFERRGLLHVRAAVPGLSQPLDCFCVHLSLHESGRRRQLGALLKHLPRTGAAIVAGDINDWRVRAGRTLEAQLGFTEAIAQENGAHARTFPSVLPVLRLDRIYVRGLTIQRAQVHRGAPWRRLSDHLALSAELGFE